MSIRYGVSGDIRSSLGTPTESEYSAASIVLAQTRATNLINAYLEKSYPSTVPFTASGDVPALVNTIATDLSVYYLKRDKHKGPTPLSDDIKGEYWDKNIELLEKISKEEIRIPELESGEGDMIQAPQKKYQQTFDEGAIEDSVIDPDKLDDISDSKG